MTDAQIDALARAIMNRLESDRGLTQSGLVGLIGAHIDSARRAEVEDRIRYDAAVDRRSPHTQDDVQ